MRGNWNVRAAGPHASHYCVNAETEDIGNPWISVVATTEALGFFFHEHILLLHLLLRHQVRCICKLKNTKLSLCRGMQAVAAWHWVGKKLGHLHHPSSWETCSCPGLRPEHLALNLNILSKNAERQQQRKGQPTCRQHVLLTVTGDEQQHLCETQMHT